MDANHPLRNQESYIQAVVAVFTWTLMITLIVLLVCIPVGCKSIPGSGLFGWLGGGAKPCPPTGDDPNGTAQTYQTLRQMASFAFVPGLLLTVASVWIPMLRSIGMVFLGIGISLAILPWFLHGYAPQIIYTGLGCAVLYFGWWFYRQVVKPRRDRKRGQMLRPPLGKMGE